VSKEADALVGRKRRLPENAGQRVELSEGAEEDAMQPLQGRGGGGGIGHAPLLGHAPCLISSHSAESVRLLGEALEGPSRTLQGPKRKQGPGYMVNVGRRRGYKCSVCLKPKKLECTCKASESSWAKQRSWTKSTWPQDRDPGLGCVGEGEGGEGRVGGGGGGGGGRSGNGKGRSRRVEQVCAVSRRVVLEHVSMSAAAGYIAVAKSTMYNAILQGHVLSGSTFRYSSPVTHELKRETQASAGVHLSRHSSKGEIDSYQTTAVSSSTGKKHSSVGQTGGAPAKYGGAPAKYGKIRRNTAELRRNTAKFGGRSADDEYGEQEGVVVEEEEASFPEIHSFSDEESRAEFVRRLSVHPRGTSLFT
jgi:hypothetical protein